MKIDFENRIEAIEWIASHVDDEGQFEALREELNYNYIYTGTFYLDLDKEIGEVILLDQNPKH